MFLSWKQRLSFVLVPSLLLVLMTAAWGQEDRFYSGTPVREAGEVVDAMFAVAERMSPAADGTITPTVQEITDQANKKPSRVCDYTPEWVAKLLNIAYTRAILRDKNIDRANPVEVNPIDVELTLQEAEEERKKTEQRTAELRSKPPEVASLNEIPPDLLRDVVNRLVNEHFGFRDWPGFLVRTVSDLSIQFREVLEVIHLSYRATDRENNVPGFSAKGVTEVGAGTRWADLSEVVRVFDSELFKKTVFQISNELIRRHKPPLIRVDATAESLEIIRAAQIVHRENPETETIPEEALYPKLPWRQPHEIHTTLGQQDVWTGFVDLNLALNELHLRPLPLKDIVLAPPPPLPSVKTLDQLPDPLTSGKTTVQKKDSKGPGTSVTLPPPPADPIPKARPDPPPTVSNMAKRTTLKKPGFQDLRIQASAGETSVPPIPAWQPMIDLGVPSPQLVENFPPPQQEASSPKFTTWKDVPSKLKKEILENFRSNTPEAKWWKFVRSTLKDLSPELQEGFTFLRDLFVVFSKRFSRTTISDAEFNKWAPRPYSRPSADLYRMVASEGILKGLVKRTYPPLVFYHAPGNGRILELFSIIDSYTSSEEAFKNPVPFSTDILKNPAWQARFSGIGIDDVSRLRFWIGHPDFQATLVQINEGRAAIGKSTIRIFFPSEEIKAVEAWLKEWNRNSKEPQPVERALLMKLPKTLGTPEYVVLMLQSEEWTRTTAFRLRSESEIKSPPKGLASTLVAEAEKEDLVEVKGEEYRLALERLQAQAKEKVLEPGEKPIRRVRWVVIPNPVKGMAEGTTAQTMAVEFPDSWEIVTLITESVPGSRRVKRALFQDEISHNESAIADPATYGANSAVFEKNARKIAQVLLRENLSIEELERYLWIVNQEITGKEKTIASLRSRKIDSKQILEISQELAVLQYDAQQLSEGIEALKLLAHRKSAPKRTVPRPISKGDPITNAGKGYVGMTVGQYASALVWGTRANEVMKNALTLENLERYNAFSAVTLVEHAALRSKLGTVILPESFVKTRYAARHGLALAGAMWSTDLFFTALRFGWDKAWQEYATWEALGHSLGVAGAFTVGRMPITAWNGFRRLQQTNETLRGLGRVQKIGRVLRAGELEAGPPGWLVFLWQEAIVFVLAEGIAKLYLPSVDRNQAKLAVDQAIEKSNDAILFPAVAKETPLPKALENLWQAIQGYEQLVVARDSTMFEAQHGEKRMMKTEAAMLAISVLNDWWSQETIRMKLDPVAWFPTSALYTGDPEYEVMKMSVPFFREHKDPAEIVEKTKTDLEEIDREGYVTGTPLYLKTAGCSEETQANSSRKYAEAFNTGKIPFPKTQYEVRLFHQMILENLKRNAQNVAASFPGNQDEQILDQHLQAVKELQSTQTQTCAQLTEQYLADGHNLNPANDNPVYTRSPRTWGLTAP